MKVRLLAVFLVLPVTLTLFLSAFAETRFSFPSESEIVGVFSLPDEKFGILGIENNTYSITSLDEHGHIDIINTDINSNDASYSCFGGSFYFYESLCEAHDAPFYYVSVSVFDPGQDLPRRKVINNAEFRGETPCAYDGSCFYIANVTKLCIYNSRMQPIGECRLDSPCSRIAAHPDGGVYCLCAGGVVFADEYGNMTELPFTADELYTVGGNIFADGTFYNKYGSILCSEHDPSNGAAILGDMYVGIKNGRLTAAENGGIFEFGDVSRDAFLACAGDTAACFTKTGGSIEAVFFTADDLTKKQEEIDTDIPTLPGGKYLIVGQGVTAHRLRTEKYPNADFARNGEPYSGKLATGVVMTSDSREFIVIVKGDISGDGNINTTDLKTAENVLFGKERLEGEYFEAADVIEDEVIDLRDVYGIYKMTER